MRPEIGSRWHFDARPYHGDDLGVGTVVGTIPFHDELIVFKHDRPLINGSTRTYPDTYFGTRLRRVA